MNQMPRRFGKYPGNDYDNRGIPTAEESFDDGYYTGRTWDKKFPTSNYQPGGPWVCGLSPYGQMMKDPDWIAYCNATRENNDEWRRGWIEGHADSKEF
jgi:hypothetical protein